MTLILPLLTAMATRPLRAVSRPVCQAWMTLHRELTVRRLIRLYPIAGGSGEMDENELRQTLGIDEDADIVGAIKTLQAKNVELEETLSADTKSADKSELRRLRRELSDVEKKLVTAEGEMNRKIIELTEENRRERAERLVESAIAAGKITPALKDRAYNMALRDPKDFEEFATQLPGVDLRERGIATDADMADIEPSQQEIEIAKQLGTWDETKPVESRMALMRQKASDRGIVLPAEAKK